MFVRPLIISTLFLCSTVHAEMKFRHHFGDRDINLERLGQTALADLDCDGDLDFVAGVSGGVLLWYEHRGSDDWVRHELGQNSPSDVGGATLDVNGDGWPDVVVGGAWYENPQDPHAQSFTRHLFDPTLRANHDLILGDLDGDGKTDVISMSDKNDVRWYAIPDDPTGRWPMTPIGEAVHAGISTGDIDGDGDLDVVRSNVWFENLGQGQDWTMHKMTEPWGASSPSFAVNATRTAPVDLNGDGRLDIVIVDNENPHAKTAWLEAPQDPRQGEWIKHPLPRNDDAFYGALHSLQLGDFDNDGDEDIFTVEMEDFPGAKPPRWFIWENQGNGKLVQHVIFDENLGGHEAVAGDVDGDGDIDLCAKPWRAGKTNALGGKCHFSYLENLSRD